MSRNLYDVTDVRTDKILFTGLSRNEVPDKIGLSAKHVYLYAQNYSIYKGIYQISAREEKTWQDEFVIRWNLITEKLRQYRGLDRIKIVEENGGNGDT